jgi:hypothetical protein
VKDLYTQAICLFSHRGDRQSLAVALCNMDGVHAETEDWDYSIMFCREALRVSREIGYLRGAVGKLGFYAKAVSHAEDALRIFYEIGLPTADEVRQQLNDRRGEAGQIEAVQREGALDLNV